jgi:hypothetical protein
MDTAIQLQNTKQRKENSKLDLKKYEGGFELGRNGTSYGIL